MRSCYSGCRQLLALMTVLIDGFSPTCQAGISTSAAGLHDQPSFTSSAVCLGVLCWDLFVLYTVELISLIERHGLSPHLYADDTQVYDSCPPAAVDALSSQVTECADDIATWMKSNRLQLNPEKTEVLWCATSRRQRQLPSTGMLIDGVHVTPAKSVRDLGTYVDADLSMRMHVKKTVSCCFAALRQLRQIRRYVPTSTFQKLVVALVHSRLDYGNCVLVGIPVHLMRRLQSVPNAAARLIFSLKRSDHITDALVSLHWLRVPERIQYKIAVPGTELQSPSRYRAAIPGTTHSCC